MNQLSTPATIAIGLQRKEITEAEANRLMLEHTENGQRHEDWIAEKASELRAKATYIDLIDAIDSAGAELGRPFEVELESVLRGNDKLAIGSLMDFALRRFFKRAVE